MQRPHTCLPSVCATMEAPPIIVLCQQAPQTAVTPSLTLSLWHASSSGCGSPSRSPVAAIGPRSNVLMHAISQEPPKAQNNILLYSGKSPECRSRQVLSHVQATVFLLASIRNVPIWLCGSCCHMHRNMLNLEFNTNGFDEVHGYTGNVAPFEQNKSVLEV